MKVLKKNAKISLIVVLIIIVTVLHYSTSSGSLGAHIAHRELYFIPILLSSFWFGLVPGLTTSVAISLLYAPHIFSVSKTGNSVWPVISQILMFNLVALILGYLVERSKRQQQQVVAVERSAALGLAATAVSHEMQDILAALKSIPNQRLAAECTHLSRDYEMEMARLEQMVDIMSSFEPKEHMSLVPHDLNTIINDRVNRGRISARASGVRFEVDLDTRGCPSRVNADSLGWVIDRIIDNALEASSNGQTIQIRSRRGGDHCEIEIRDEGPGIKPEDLTKVFKPFFTTKGKRDGLSLSASQKTIREMGGEIRVNSAYGHGATFIVIIPRQDSARYIREHLP